MATASRMRYTVILVPAQGDWVSAVVPAMPGCVAQGRNRDEALANVRDAMQDWFELEAAQGRAPVEESAALVLSGVAQALETLDDMRAAGELPAGVGYGLEVTTVEMRQPIAA